MFFATKMLEKVSKIKTIVPSYCCSTEKPYGNSIVGNNHQF